METSPDLLQERPNRRVLAITARVWLTGAALALAAIVGVVLVLRFVAVERERDMRAWQLRLGIVADSRAAAVEAWLDQQWSLLGVIADNPSARLYLTELAAAGGNPQNLTDSEGRADYLRNLLTLAADRGGFTGAVLGPDIPANVGRSGVAGLAILDAKGAIVAGTRGVPVADPALENFVAGRPKAKDGFRDLFLDAAGQPAVGFIAPIYRVQGEPRAEDQVGWVLGVKEVASELYPLLRQPGAVENTGEAVLVRLDGATIQYASPLADGHAPLSLSLARNTPDLDAAAALAAPGGFGLKRDYRDRPVLFTSRAIKASPWLLIYKVDAAEALADTDQRQQRLLTVFLLAILLVTAAMAALWRHGASQRAAAAADRLRAIALELDRQRKFLRLVTDSQPNAIVILDKDGRYRFANRRAGEQVGIDQEDMIGKTVTAVQGPDAARHYERLDHEAVDNRAPRTAVRRAGTGPAERVLQSHHIPLPAGLDGPDEVLVVEEDITAAIREHERLAATLQHLLANLVALVDRRDPFAARHSGRVAGLARAIATEMGLEPTLIETADIAGRLLNLGKIFVPSQILTRADRLSAEEVAQVRGSLQAVADFLEGISFDGPVVETLRQCQEHWDGTGRPRGLSGDAILPTARAVALANSFIAMISQRAYRPRLSIDDAATQVLAEVGRRFDRGSVVALMNYLDNKGGRAIIESQQSSDTSGAAGAASPTAQRA